MVCSLSLQAFAQGPGSGGPGSGGPGSGGPGSGGPSSGGPSSGGPGSGGPGSGGPGSGGPGSGSPGSGGTGNWGDWNHSTVEGFPQYTYTLTANPGSYPWEGSYPQLAEDGGITDQGFGGQHAPGGQQMVFSAYGSKVHASSQANISVAGFFSAESDLKTVSGASFSKIWEFVGDPLTATPVNFGGSASISWDLSCQGSTGYDSGYFLDPAYSTSTAGFSAGWQVGNPFNYNENQGLTIVGNSDNQAGNSSINKIGVGVGTAGIVKIFGVLVDFNEPSSENTGLNYMSATKASASDSIEAMEVNGPGSITYSWNVSVTAATNLTVYSNDATGTADAEATVGMNFGIVPVAVNENSIAAGP